MSAILTTVQGDVTVPQRTVGKKVYIPHCCNDIGGWGSGFVNAVTARWGSSCRYMYKQWFDGKRGAEVLKEGDIYIKTQTRFHLGGMQMLHLSGEDTFLINMIGQHGVKGMEERPPIRYVAMAQAMYNLYGHISASDAGVDGSEIHCPKFGSDLAGGDWKTIEAMIQEVWVDNGINVVVYEWVPPTA